MADNKNKGSGRVLHPFILWIINLLIFFGMTLFLVVMAPTGGTVPDLFVVIYLGNILVGVIAFCVMVWRFLFDEDKPVESKKSKVSIFTKIKRIFSKFDRNEWYKFIGVASLVILTVSVAVYLLTFAFGKILPSKARSVEDCLKLGSDYRARVCLLELETRNTQKATNTYFPINMLEITSHGMTGNSGYIQNPTLAATVRNKANTPVTSVTLRVRFYNATSTGLNCDNIADDTQYVTFNQVILSGDTRRFQSIVATPFDTSGRFSWCVDIVGATGQ